MAELNNRLYSKLQNNGFKIVGRYISKRSNTDNKFKVVATILFRNKLSRIGGITGTYALTKRILIEHILEEFIKSCK